jgi:dimeric dUTPase (all-alpha-NTP-PPase superfamily)
MSYVNVFNECLTLQNATNTLVNPDWRKAGYRWRRAMWVESAELLDLVGYKWWKDIDSKPDTKQILLEVVDIFHFLLSEHLLYGKKADDLYHAYKWAKSHTYAPTKEHKIRQIEEFVVSCLDNGVISTTFFQVVVALDIDIESLTKYYLGKNALNKFRQDNGYKNGTYQKQWMFNGELVEDNKVLETIIESSSVTNFQTIYTELKTIYDQMTVV